MGRLPTATHWGSYFAEAAEGRVVALHPAADDGDASPIGPGMVEALYAPARIHVITDRPLYQPGNTVRFRAVALRARDLTPLDHRPGSWVVTDPGGEVLLEEAAPAGDWGVVAGSFHNSRRGERYWSTAALPDRVRS